jgi:hypothetical protein
VLGRAELERVGLARLTRTGLGRTGIGRAGLQCGMWAAELERGGKQGAQGARGVGARAGVGSRLTRVCKAEATSAWPGVVRGAARAGHVARVTRRLGPGCARGCLLHLGRRPPSSGARGPPAGRQRRHTPSSGDTPSRPGAVSGAGCGHVIAGRNGPRAMNRSEAGTRSESRAKCGEEVLAGSVAGLENRSAGGAGGRGRHGQTLAHAGLR